MAWIYPLKKKSDAFSIFQEWMPLFENESGQHVKLFVLTMGQVQHLNPLHFIVQ